MARSAKRTREADVVLIVASIMATSEPSRFRFEALCRHTLRAARCLQGMPWQKADDWAAQIVSKALVSVGAQRPDWKMGQPEFTQPGIFAESRTRCVQCGRRLPETHHKYCGPECAQAAHNRAYYRDNREDLIAYQRAHRAAKKLNGTNGANGATSPCRSAPSGRPIAAMSAERGTLQQSPQSNEPRRAPADTV